MKNQIIFMMLFILALAIVPQVSVANDLSPPGAELCIDIDQDEALFLVCEIDQTAALSIFSQFAMDAATFETQMTTSTLKPEPGKQTLKNFIGPGDIRGQ